MAEPEADPKQSSSWAPGYTAYYLLVVGIKRTLKKYLLSKF